MIEEHFNVTIQCLKCMSINCENYIKEADDKESKNTFEEHVIIHVCPHKIRYRCLTCNHIFDVEA